MGRSLEAMARRTLRRHDEFEDVGNYGSDGILGNKKADAVLQQALQKAESNTNAIFDLGVGENYDEREKVKIVFRDGRVFFKYKKNEITEGTKGFKDGKLRCLQTRGGEVIYRDDFQRLGGVTAILCRDKEKVKDIRREFSNDELIRNMQIEDEKIRELIARAEQVSD